VAAGTTGAGEGNVLVSDRHPGPELELALRSSGLWRQHAQKIGGETFEFEEKGGVVVADSTAELDGLRQFGTFQSGAGVEVQALSADDLQAIEPHIAQDLAGGAFYPQDIQVQPMLAAARILQAARALGAELRLGDEVLGLRRSGARLTGVTTSGGSLSAGWVVNAAGAWSQELSARFGAEVPVAPRRGYILVTEPLPRIVRHKVYSASYASSVASDAADLQIAAVVEGTTSGPILIGSSRERVGFDRGLSMAVVQQMARAAVRLFPTLANARILRSYAGFRPFSPDHLPIIGLDDRVAGLVHACGHEGSGIGLAPATGELVASLVTGTPGPVDGEPFSPNRFADFS
jgi:glycine/D-amino acid oxidase-like deaminating enzyme